MDLLVIDSAKKRPVWASLEHISLAYLEKYKVEGISRKEAT